ncbi:hypothetical protein FQN51_002380 [Onygenales sp. PD_10]|nr:hypothetical protein FQN51_002380 [Onygenales sp. PD_10]
MALLRCISLVLAVVVVFTMASTSHRCKVWAWLRAKVRAKRSRSPTSATMTQSKIIQPPTTQTSQPQPQPQQHPQQPHSPPPAAAAAAAAMDAGSDHTKHPDPPLASSTPNTTAKMNGVANPASPAVPTTAAAQDKPTDPAGDATQKLSGAELKKRAKAEKAARRAKEKQGREEGGAPGGAQHQQPGGGSSSSKKGGAPSQKGGAAEGGPSGGKGQKQSGGATGKAGTLAGRRGSIAPPASTAELKKKKKREDEAAKTVAVFSHLSLHKRRLTIAGAGKEIHPAILALGLQMRDYVVCGSSARCVAMLLAFKRVIESYSTPAGTSLTRHLMTHLSHQISYLSSCRPLSISQGNAIRATKVAISAVDPSCPESEAKESLCDFIDSFIREKVTFADQVIANSAAQKVSDGDVILCYAGSNIVQKTLLTAHSQGKKFRVSIIDSRPLFEGRKLARTLAEAGLQVQYSLVHGISHALKEATKVFLGAHSMTSNGRLFNRVGTALVAMSAKERAGGINIPVIVCCETIKFTDRVALDSIVLNELADADELAATEASEQVTNLPLPPAAKNGSTASLDTASTGESSLITDPNKPLEHWKEKPRLQLLNIMYDVTPAEYIDMVITEMGSLPPSAVPIVHRMSTNS